MLRRAFIITVILLSTACSWASEGKFWVEWDPVTSDTLGQKEHVANYLLYVSPMSGDPTSTYTLIEGSVSTDATTQSLESRKRGETPSASNTVCFCRIVLEQAKFPRPSLIVCAVDEAGNESEPSEAIVLDNTNPFAPRKGKGYSIGGIARFLHLKK